MSIFIGNTAGADYVRLFNVANLPKNSFTIIVKVKRSTDTANYTFPICLFTAGGTHMTSIGTDGTGFDVKIADDWFTVSSPVLTTVQASDGWVGFALQGFDDGGTTTFRGYVYKKGRIYTDTLVPVISDATDTINVGSNFYDNYPGDYSDFRMWNSTLSRERVTREFLSVNPVTTSSLICATKWPGGSDTSDIWNEAWAETWNFQGATSSSSETPRVMINPSFGGN